MKGKKNNIQPKSPLLIKQYFVHVTLLYIHFSFIVNNHNLFSLFFIISLLFVSYLSTRKYLVHREYIYPYILHIFGIYSSIYGMSMQSLI